MKYETTINDVLILENCAFNLRIFRFSIYDFLQHSINNIKADYKYYLKIDFKI